MTRLWITYTGDVSCDDHLGYIGQSDLRARPNATVLHALDGPALLADDNDRRHFLTQTGMTLECFTCHPPHLRPEPNG